MSFISINLYALFQIYDFLHFIILFGQFIKNNSLMSNNCIVYLKCCNIFNNNMIHNILLSCMTIICTINMTLFHDEKS